MEVQNYCWHQVIFNPFSWNFDSYTLLLNHGSFLIYEGSRQWSPIGMWETWLWLYALCWQSHDHGLICTLLGSRVTIRSPVTLLVTEKKKILWFVVASMCRTFTPSESAMVPARSQCCQVTVAASSSQEWCHCILFDSLPQRHVSSTSSLGLQGWEW